MKEDFVHHLWKFKKFDFLKATTTEGEKIQILQSGQHNQDHAGPDFFNARVKIADQLWAGNVEIHLKSSDWYAHHHHTDSAYDNVILHVVWEDDVSVYRKDNSAIPTVQICDFTPKNALENYRNLLGNSSKKWINCEKDFASFSDFAVENWLERLFFERLERKHKAILEQLEYLKNDWDAVFFQLMAKNFGLNKNGEAFLKIAQSVPYAVIRKLDTPQNIEALLFGQANMLPQETDDAYVLQLKKEYAFLKNKYQLEPLISSEVNYFRLRPSNFPTIRLSQLAVLFSGCKNLFSGLMETKTLPEIRKLLKAETTTYWKTHYSFGKESRATTKKMSSSFQDLLLINTLAPIKFAYARYSGKEITEELIVLLSALPAEKNSITQNFNRLRNGTVQDALHSQAVLELKHNYCDPNRCLACNLGLELLQRS